MPFFGQAVLGVQSFLLLLKGDGHLGSISAHGKLFIKSHDFNLNCQLDIVKLELQDVSLHSVIYSGSAKTFFIKAEK